MTFSAEPEKDCDLCPRLVEFRNENIQQNPDWFNGPVPSFGTEDAQLLIVGLAPGLQGANRTGRPFTGDFAGDLLYKTLLSFDFAEGEYAKHIDDGLELKNCMISNAVRCVPPQNKPIGSEIKSCRDFLGARIESLSNLKIILALGRIAHESTLSALSIRKADFPFKHGIGHKIREGLTLFDSYHCSRYNTNTGRLTVEMFQDVFRDIKSQLS